MVLPLSGNSSFGAWLIVCSNDGNSSFGAWSYPNLSVMLTIRTHLTPLKDLFPGMFDICQNQDCTIDKFVRLDVDWLVRCLSNGSF